MPSSIFETILFVIPLLCVKFSPANGQGHFVKDQFADKHDFPPPMPEIVRGIPQGHLRPLGYQKRSSGRIRPIKSEFGSLKNISQKCIEAKLPCFLEQHWNPPAKELWGDKYFSVAFKSENFFVTVLEGKNATQIIMPTVKFLKSYHYEEWRIDNPLLEVMMKDLIVPGGLQCPYQAEYLQYANFHLSSGPTSIPLFTEGEDSLHCVLSGRLDFIVIAPEHKEKLVFKSCDDEHVSTWSKEISTMDVNVVNMFDEQNKELSKIPWRWATLHPGDCAYLPSGYLRQIRSYSRALSLVFYTTPLATVHKDCNHAVVNNDLQMEPSQFLWKFGNNKWVPTNLPWTAALLDRHLKSLMSNGDMLTKKDFIKFFNRVTQRPLTDDSYEANNAYLNLSPADELSITEESVEKILTSAKEKIIESLQFVKATAAPVKEEL